MHTHGAEFHLTYAKLPQIVQQVLSKIFSALPRVCCSFRKLARLLCVTLGLNPKQVIVLPNPCELPTEVPERKNRTQISLVCCGRVGQRKGTFDLIKAFANLPNHQKKYTQLILAGDGEIEKAQQLAVVSTFQTR